MPDCIPIAATPRFSSLFRDWLAQPEKRSIETIPRMNTVARIVGFLSLRI